MKKLLLIFLIAILSVPAASLKSEEPVSKVPAEILDKQYVCEIIRHLYRWYLDEIDIESIAGEKIFVFNIRMLDIPLDKDDKSQYAEILIPMLKISVQLKKADYRIEELDIDIKSNGFKISNVARFQKNFELPADATKVEVDTGSMREYLAKTRHNVEFPDENLLVRIRKAFADEMKNEKIKNVPLVGEPEQVIHIAPLSPVANEIWTFRENGNILIRCSSDIDIKNQSVWEHDPLTFHTYDVYNQMVVSLEETIGDNSFMTRDQIGRALYNCIVLGKRIVIKKNPEPTK